MVHLKGRFTQPSRECVWEVEAAVGGAHALGPVRRLICGETMEVVPLPEVAKTLHLLKRTAPALFAQLTGAAVGATQRHR